jgi:molecular chaperone DnaJ
LFADVFQQAAREATTPSRGTDIDASVQLAFKDAVRGGASPISVVRQDRCSTCAGDGRVARPAVVCPSCDGTGHGGGRAGTWCSPARARAARERDA